MAQQAPAIATAIPKMEDPGPLRAGHTPDFPGLLRQLGASLLVTTYQAGKLVMVREEGTTSSRGDGWRRGTSVKPLSLTARCFR
jgi:hypothetical protein